MARATSAGKLRTHSAQHAADIVAHAPLTCNALEPVLHSVLRPPARPVLYPVTRSNAAQLQSSLPQLIATVLATHPAVQGQRAQLDTLLHAQM